MYRYLVMVTVKNIEIRPDAYGSEGSNTLCLVLQYLKLQ